MHHIPLFSQHNKFNKLYNTEIDNVKKLESVTKVEKLWKKNIWSIKCCILNDKGVKSLVKKEA